MYLKDIYSSWASKKVVLPSFNILAVDDDLAIRVILHNVLKRDFNISAVSNGLEALSWLKKGNDPDLIISDITMPEINGFDFISTLSRSGLYRTTPVLILSGCEEQTVRDRLWHINNPISFISKPFDPLKVLGYVKEHAIRGNHLVV